MPKSGTRYMVHRRKMAARAADQCVPEISVTAISAGSVGYHADIGKCAPDVRFKIREDLFIAVANANHIGDRYLNRVTTSAGDEERASSLIDPTGGTGAHHRPTTVFQEFFSKFSRAARRAPAASIEPDTPRYCYRPSLQKAPARLNRFAALPESDRLASYPDADKRHLLSVARPFAELPTFALRFSLRSVRGAGTVEDPSEHLFGAALPRTSPAQGKEMDDRTGNGEIIINY